MATIRTTAGSLAVNQALPEDLRDYDRYLDKKQVNQLLAYLAQKHPDQYREVTHKLLDVAANAAYHSGSNSFGLEHLKTPPKTSALKQQLKARVREIAMNPQLDGVAKRKAILDATTELNAKLADIAYEEALAADNPLARQVATGSRGNKAQLARLIAGDLMYADHRGREIPMPVVHSYSEGLSPAEYWAGTYGSRRGLIGTKLCLAENTLVQLPDGRSRKIQEIKPGEWVLGANRFGETYPVQVARVFDNGLRDCYRYHCARECGQKFEITCTPDHKFLGFASRISDSNFAIPKLLPISRAMRKSHFEHSFQFAPLAGPAERPARQRPLVYPEQVNQHISALPKNAWSCSEQDLAQLLQRMLCNQSRLLPYPKHGLLRFYFMQAEPARAFAKLLELRLGLNYYRLRRRFVNCRQRRPGEVKQCYCLDYRHTFTLTRILQLCTAYPLADPLPVKLQKKLIALTDVLPETALQEVRTRFVVRDWEPVGLLPTYDLEVTDDEHLFVLACGVISSNSVQQAGYLGKQLFQANHASPVIQLDGPEPDENEVAENRYRGLPVGTDDNDSEGALLAAPVAGYKRNTVITPKILADLRKQNITDILVRSPLVGGHASGGLYARDVGVREFGRLPQIGENPAIVAGQAISEPVSQNMLGSKHSAGVVQSRAQQTSSGFRAIEQLLQVPKQYPNGAAHADLDGKVEKIEPADTGGTYVWVGGTRHYVPEGFAPTVKPGQEVEAGDVLSEGLPNPALLVKHKGVGEGRRAFVQALRQVLQNSGVSVHRRNLELVSRNILNHVELTDSYGEHLPGEVLPYHTIEQSYQPREDAEEAADQHSVVGKYLERPYLHYSVGTKVRPSVWNQLQKFGVKRVQVHKEPPPFQPTMVQLKYNLRYHPDWQTQMLGSNLQKNLLTAAHRGSVSDTHGGSFVPGMAKGVNFGEQGLVQTPQNTTQQVSPLLKDLQ